jgi:hypothetical protein
MPATSEKQKRFFGAVMGAKKGQKGVTGAAKQAAKGMSKKQIKDFLKTEEDAEQPKKITQKDTLKGIRKQMPPPQKTFDSSNKKKYNRQKFKDYFKGY